MEKLAELKYDGNWRHDGSKVRALAVRWAKEHPDAEGYLQVSDVTGWQSELAGAAYFRVLTGKVERISYIDTKL